jgi:hypothetical protein
MPESRVQVDSGRDSCAARDGPTDGIFGSSPKGCPDSLTWLTRIAFVISLTGLCAEDEIAKPRALIDTLSDLS